MPGSVQNAAPSTVLPQSLSRAFAHDRAYPVIENEYGNGEFQRSALATTSRKQWRLAKRLAPAQLAALRDFYDARKGPTEPFYFYDPYETNPKSTLLHKLSPPASPEHLKAVLDSLAPSALSCRMRN